MRAGEWLVVSGQVGMADGRIVSGGITGEVTKSLRNLEAQLATQGAQLSDVVKTTVFLRHMSDYAQMNEAYIAVFGDHRPGPLRRRHLRATARLAGRSGGVGLRRG